MTLQMTETSGNVSIHASNRMKQELMMKKNGIPWDDG